MGESYGDFEVDLKGQNRDEWQKNGLRGSGTLHYDVSDLWRTWEQEAWRILFGGRDDGVEWKAHTQTCQYVVVGDETQGEGNEELQHGGCGNEQGGWTMVNDMRTD